MTAPGTTPADHAAEPGAAPGVATEADIAARQEAGYLHVDGWAGRRLVRVHIVAREGRRLRVRTAEAAHLPRRGYCKAGTVLLVPAHAVAPEAPA